MRTCVSVQSINVVAEWDFREIREFSEFREVRESKEYSDYP